MSNNSENIVIAKRYAKALRASSGNVSAAKKNLLQVQDLVNIFKSEKELFDIVTSPVISRAEIKSIFAEIAKKFKFDKSVESFLLILAEERRISALFEIEKKLSEIINNEEGVIVTSVVSAKKLDSKSFDNIKDQLEKITGKKVELNSQVDKSLIGGVKIKIGSQLFDDSISSKLEGLKASLANC